MGLLRDLFPRTDDPDYMVYEGDYDTDYSDIDQQQAAQEYQKSRPWFKIALAGGALVTAAGLVVILAESSNSNHAPSASAEAFPGDTPTPSEVATDTPTPTTTPSATETPSSTPSASATSALPSPTRTHRVILPIKPSPSHTPSASPTAEKSGNCDLNPNAPAPDFAHRQVICTTEVQTYTSANADTPSFVINGPAEINCDDPDNGYVRASISNAVGFVSLGQLAFDVCN